jgi:tripartite-type tricarboxylate transporter receptor subunit TctC
MQKCCALVLLSGTLLMTQGVVQGADSAAKNWPEKTVRLVVPFAPGGANDLIARILGPALYEELGQAFVVDNRAGASGNIGTEIVVGAQPDGHTVLVGNVSTNAINPTGFAGLLKYNAVKDLTGVTMLSTIPNLLVSGASFPPKDFKELVAYARARPEQLNYSNPIGAYSHLDMLRFMSQAGIKMLHVPTKGAGATIAAVLSGEIHFYFTNAATATPHVLGGKMKAYATTANERLSDLKNVPTMAEVGFPDIRGHIWIGFFLPAATPRAVTDKLYASIEKATQRPQTRALFAKARIPLTLSKSPADFQKYVVDETARWAKVIKDYDVKYY